MSRHPEVTVFIPAFNRRDYIAPAIHSILAQEYKDFELLVVDDGSTDGTAEFVEAIADHRIRVERNSCNLGIPATRNRGLELARGRYIALLDSDDYAYPHRLARQWRFLRRHPDVVQVGSWCSLMDADGGLLSRVRRYPTRPADVAAHLMFHCSLVNRTIMARTAVLREYGYDESFPRCQDYDLHRRLSERHAMANLPEILVCGREHAGRITRNTRDTGRERKIAIQRRLLADLEVEANARELAWHYHLAQPWRGTEAPDVVEYLDWAEAWLSNLDIANRRCRRFDPAAFRRVLGAVWAGACWRHRSGSGRRWPLRLLGARPARWLAGNLQPGWFAAAILRRPQPPQLVTDDSAGRDPA